ncbi:FadR/GntR family transcriptional regulator [Portibacter lacus]|uniref:GntR family transcriptional regulator n=1 Tax=Portibacter lacus TaxID=1099794 RepID=A0AA37SQT1_9BACT|nr:GntR family transcriptional regulator [Portibacter lacus]GLR17904.1 GntR family transcriptional regulator [Portibacter lacus]
MENNDLDINIVPIKNASLADLVEKKLMEYLKSNNFNAGDSLPKEMELAEALGVSRNVVREGLSRLKMLGMVESKKRKGMIITEPDILSSMTRLMDPALLSEETMQDVFELRLVLEVGMSDLLFIRKTEKDILRLRNIAEREAKDPKCKTSQKVRSKYEIEFHGKLYSMTGNSTLTRFQKMLLPIFNYMMVVEAKLEEEPPRGKINHFDLIDAIEHGTAEEFRNKMREHLTPHYARFK